MPVLDSFETGRRIGQGGRTSGIDKGADMAFSALLERLSEKRKQSGQLKSKAQEVAIENRPELAYSILGIETPTEELGGTPEGMRPKSQTVKRGQTSTTYESPEQLDMTKLFGYYNQYRIELDKNNALLGLTPGYRPQPITPFDQWLSQSGILNMMQQQVIQNGLQGGIQDELNKQPVQSTPGGNVQGDQVVMFTPDGRPIQVHRTKIEEAKKRGLKEKGR